MTKRIIPIDFVAGSHGHYLETVCNQEFGIVEKENNFTAIGTSHSKSTAYQENKLFDANHWFELYQEKLAQHPDVVSIQFSKNDLLLLSSVSMLRAGDDNIDNDYLEVDTVNKLLTTYYQNVLYDIKQAYPFVDFSSGSIPRNVLREYYKFGFRDPEVNGYWKKQQQMKYLPTQNVFVFEFSWFYDPDIFVVKVKDLAYSLGFKFFPTDEFYIIHQKFLSYNPFTNHKQQCDQVIDAVINHRQTDIPKLSLFQESYINGCLEKIYHKEMPFHQDRYFTCTKDVLYYLKNLAPTL